MNRNWSGVIVAALAVLAASGCNLELRGPSAGNVTVAYEDTLTAIYQTRFAEGTAAKLTADARLPSSTPTLAPPTNTPSPTLSPTPGKVTITVSKNTNCRAGPEKQFDLVGVMKDGETAEAIGRKADSAYWVIHLPSTPAKTCWLWSEWATVTGDGQALPIIESPPTPTWYPRPDLSLAYAGITSCVPNYYLIVEIENTGNVVLESVRMTLEDITEGETVDHPSDSFIWINGCGIGADLPSLAPGAKANVSFVWFDYNPAGHNVHVIIKVCTENSLAGICQKSDFYITLP